MKDSHSYSLVSRLLKSLLASLRKLILGNLARVSLHGLLWMWSRIQLFLRSRWSQSKSKEENLHKNLGPGRRQSQTNGGANENVTTSSAVYLPSLRLGSIPQDLNTLHPTESIRHEDQTRSYVSLPDPTTAVHHSQIILPMESDSPVQAQSEDIPQIDVEFSHPRIRPFVPEMLPRYDRNIKVPRRAVKYMIPPLTTSFDMPHQPPGWTSCFHPEGALYFFHEEKVGNYLLKDDERLGLRPTFQRVFTDSNLYDNDTLATIESDLADVEAYIRFHNIKRTKETDLVLDLQNEDDEIKTFYYLIDHSSRSVFSLDNMSDRNFPSWEEVKGVVSPTHAKHQIEANYWYHCLLFPRSIELSEDLILEFRDLIVHSMGDKMVSATSVVPYSIDDLQKLLLLANSLQAIVDSKFTGSTCLLSAFMYEFVRQRFYNFYGQPAARMNTDQSVYGEVKNQRSWLIRLLSPILFFAPQVHLHSLEEIWVDGITRRAPWADFMSKLISDWQEFTLYSTVVLNANVAFLAIQSVDSSSQGDVRSPAQIASYTSITTSIGSIILGLLLVRQNRSQDQSVVTNVSSFLARRNRQALGLESLAIMYSLPYALLMWGMVCFLIAFLFVCFDGSNLSTRLVVGATWVSITTSIMCCIWMTWDMIPGFPVLGHSLDAEGEEESQELASKQELPEKNEDTNVGSKTLGISWKWMSIFRRGTDDSDATVV